MLILLFSTAKAIQFDDENNSYTLENGTATFVNSRIENALIPENILFNNNEYLVTKIIPEKNPNIKSISIPPTIETIQNIKNFENLEIISFSTSSNRSRVLRVIGESWFDGSSITGTVTIPKTVNNHKF